MCPSRIGYIWRFGFVLGILIVLQIITGLVLTCFFFTREAFSSVFYLSRETGFGELFRFFHGNGVTVVFIALYMHVFRGMVFRRYYLFPVWSRGLILFLLLVIVAFLGYRLPWAQISFWAATVITNLATSIPFVGQNIVTLLWGNFSVSLLTLNRFYTLHFLLPFIILCLVVVHILALHLIHTKSPLQLKGIRTTFYPLFLIKDVWLFFCCFLLLVLLVSFSPVVFIERDMFLEANPIRAPEHIVPEWYFLPFYAVLRAVPSKLGGVCAILLVFLFLFAIALSRIAQERIINFLLGCLGGLWGVLFWVGGLPVVYPFDLFGGVVTLLFFVVFSIIVLQKGKNIFSFEG